MPFGPASVAWCIPAHTTFLYSKYWEWLDTLFLVLSGRAVSWLQYTHHMSTAILVSTGGADVYAPVSIIPAWLNCAVHVPMYWYFAYPRGALRPYAPWITRAQILQHVAVVGLCSYANFRQYLGDGDCYNGDKYMAELGLVLYAMYLAFFVAFYARRFARGGSTKRAAHMD